MSAREHVSNVLIPSQGDINAPPGLSKKENDEKSGVDFDKIINKSQLNFKGKLTPEKSEQSKKEHESSSDEDEQKEKPRMKRNDSIDMPSVVENDNNNQDSNEAEKCAETSSKDVNDDLEISDSDDSNSKPPDTSDAKNFKETKTEPKEVEIEDPDDYLLYLEDILKTVHKAYYDLYDQSKSDSAVPAPDLKTVIPYVKRKVLAGLVLVFSGVIPTQVALEKSKPFLLARSLGAVVRSSVDKRTTHLVAARLGTAKVRRLGVSCV